MITFCFATCLPFRSLYFSLDGVTNERYEAERSNYFPVHPIELLTYIHFNINE